MYCSGLQKAVNEGSVEFMKQASSANVRMHISSWLEAFIFLTPLAALYLYCTPSTLPDFDSGEFAIIALKGGIAHPPGYPLLSVLLQAAARIGGNLNPVFVLCTVSIVCSVGAAALIFRILHEYTQNIPATLAGVYGAFLTTIVWRASTTIEPFALNLFLAALLLYSFWQILKPREALRSTDAFFILSGLSFGLGFCNHHSLAFFLPFAAITWWFGAVRRFNALVFFAVGALVGLLPLLYFFSDLSTGPYIWGNWESPFQRLIIHLFRQEYGTFSLTTWSQGHWYNGILHFIQILPKELSGIFLVFVVGGAVVSLKRFKQGKQHFLKSSVFHAGIWISLLFTGGVFLGMMKIGDADLEKAVTERFFALPLMLLAFPMAQFCAWTQKFRSNKKVYATLVVALIAFHASWQVPYSDRRSETFYEAHIRNILTMVEDNAAIVTHADASYFGLLYGQHVLRLKSDVAIAQHGLWETIWYRKPFLQQQGMTSDSSFSNVVAAMMKNRPVYILDSIPGMDSLLQHSYPIGPLIRLVKPDRPLPEPAELFAHNLQVLNNFTLPNLQDRVHATCWEASLLTPYQRTWDSLAKAFSHDGKDHLAAMCREYEKNFIPRLP